MLRYYKTSRGFDVYRGPERLGSLTIAEAPAGGVVKGVTFRSVGGGTATFASVAAAQLRLQRMYKS